MKKKKQVSLCIKLTILSIILLIGAGVGIYFSPAGEIISHAVMDVKNLMAQKAHFELEQVVVEGHIRTNLEDIKKKLNLEQGMPILEIDLEEKKEAVLGLPWIKTVRIERHLPAQLFILVTEKTPIAVWQNKKKYLPIDEAGEKIEDDKTVLKNVLLVVGEDAPQHTPELIQALNQYPQISELARSAVRVGNRRWNLYLNDVENGLEIRLPEANIENALERLQEFDDSGQILERELKVIDLKLPDRLIVRSSGTQQTNGEGNATKK